MDRDDSSSFLLTCQDAEVLSNTPFAGLDQEGVGKLVEVGVKGGRSNKKKPRSVSAAKTGETLIPWISSPEPGSTTCPVLRSGSRSSSWL